MTHEHDPIPEGWVAFWPDSDPDGRGRPILMRAQAEWADTPSAEDRGTSVPELDVYELLGDQLRLDVPDDLDGMEDS